MEKYFNERLDREMGNLVDTVDDTIQNEILTAIAKIITHRNELAVRSINASFGRNATNVTANSQHGERLEITASFENVSERNNTLHISNTSDETQKKLRTS